MPTLYPAFFFVLGKAAKAQETQSYQRFQHIGRTAFNTSGTNAATFVSTGCGGYTRHPSPEPRTQRLTGRNRGVSGGGRYHYPRSVLRGSETLCGRVSERHTLPLLGLGRERSRKMQRACGTAMRSCASLFRGVAAPQGRAAPLLFLALHR